jgi:hypothetical protein
MDLILLLRIFLAAIVHESEDPLYDSIMPEYTGRPMTAQNTPDHRPLNPIAADKRIRGWRH